MSEINITAEQANQIRKEAQEKIALADALTKLQANPDFEKLIMKDYLEQEAIRLTHLMAEPSFYMSDKANVYAKDIQERLMGIARFAEYTRNVFRTAEQAKKTLYDLEHADVEYIEQ